MPKFAWYCGTTDETRIIDATDEDTALRIVLAARMRMSGQSLEEAHGWFLRKDAITKIVGTVADAPFEGDIPED